ncbi:MAG: anion permease [Ignavibacteriaceae bacterium]
MKTSKFQEFITKYIFRIPEEGTSPERYKALRRNIIILMILVTVIPLSLMAIINYYQYQKNLRDEIISPMNVLTNKTKRSFELFLEERLSTVRFIASAYSYQELSNPAILNRILSVLKREFDGFVDLRLISNKGKLLCYAGSYSFSDKNYSQQSWYHKVLISGRYISDVFLGYREFPHIAIAVFVLLMTNFIMNVAATAISLPVALVIAPYMHVASEVILFAALVTAGMPFMLLVGAAPNAIAYDSRQFTSGEFFKYGVIASIILLVVLGLIVLILWPLMGMPITMN